MLCNFSVKADVNFNDIKAFLPEELIAQGVVKADLNVRGTVDQFANADLMHTKVSGNLKFKDLAITYSDTINVNTSDMSIDFALPNPSGNILKDGRATS